MHAIGGSTYIHHYNNTLKMGFQQSNHSTSIPDREDVIVQGLTRMTPKTGSYNAYCWPGNSKSLGGPTCPMTSCSPKYLPNIAIWVLTSFCPRHFIQSSPSSCQDLAYSPNRSEIVWLWEAYNSSNHYDRAPPDHCDN